ncbi:plasmid mobilization protein [Clostridioides difficile]
MLFSKNKEKRDKPLQIRFTESEKEELKKIATFKNLKMTEFILNAIDYYIEHECKDYKKK